MKIVIAGARAIGTYLAKLLSRNNEEIILIDDDEDSLDNISTNFDVLTLHAHPGSISALRQAGVQECDLYIAVTLDQHVNLESCAIAKALGAKQTVAKVEDYEFANPENHDTLKASGVDSVIYPELLGAKDIINGLKMSWVRLRWDVHNGALVMLGIKLRETAEILNQPLKDICGPEEPYLIVAIKRGNETIIPNGNDELQANDLAYFMTKRNYIPLIRKLVGKEGYADVKNVMVMGGGKTAVRTASTLPDYMNMKIIEKDPARCELLNELLLDTDRVLVINGDGRDVSLLIEEGIKNTQAFVAITGNAETNILACLTAKKLGVRKTVAMVENLDYVPMADSLDIGTVINKKTVAASHIFQMMLKADVRNLRSLMMVDADVAEFVAAEGSKVTKKPVKELGLPFGITIGGLVRDGKGILVNGNTQILTGDSVMVFCHRHHLEQAEKFFKKSLLW